MKILIKFITFFILTDIAISQIIDKTTQLKANYEINVDGKKRILTLSTNKISIKQKGKTRVFHTIAEPNISKEIEDLRTKLDASNELELILTASKKDPKTSSQKDPNHHFVTRDILVRLNAGVSAKAIAEAAGLRFVRQPEYAQAFFIFQAATSEKALIGMETLRAMPEVESADVLL